MLIGWRLWSCSYPLYADRKKLHSHIEILNILRNSSNYFMKFLNYLQKTKKFRKNSKKIAKNQKISKKICKKPKNFVKIRKKQNTCILYGKNQKYFSKYQKIL